MDISKQLQEELWESIKKSYLSEDYTTAILNAIAYLRDIIREKSNLESDGVDLINQAFSFVGVVRGLHPTDFYFMPILFNYKYKSRLP